MITFDKDKKRNLVRDALKEMPHATEADVEFVLAMDQSSLANGDGSFFDEDALSYKSQQTGLSNFGNNATNNSMNSNVQQSNISIATNDVASNSVQNEKPTPERTATQFVGANRINASGLQASSYLTDHLKKMEGYAPKVANEGYGNETGGYGHVEGLGDGWYPSMDVPKSYANQLLRRDVAEAERTVKRMVGNLPLRQHEYDALVDLAFNVGATQLNAANSPKLNAAINAGNYKDIAGNLAYSKANGQISQGLANRSASRKDVFDSSVYGRRY